jgi:hypothetical protein
MNAQPSIKLHIEELVLHGFALADSHAIGDILQEELARLLREQGVPSSLRVERATDEIKGATFNLALEAKPRTIGRQIANAVYGGFNQ